MALLIHRAGTLISQSVLRDIFRYTMMKTEEKNNVIKKGKMNNSTENGKI